MLWISLFRKLQIKRDGQVLTGLDTRKGQELFCYLLLYRNRPHPREALAGLLWPKSTTVQSIKYLRQTLWQLQAALEPSSETERTKILQADAEWISLNPTASFWLDVDEFERAYTRVQGISGPELVEEDSRTMQEALKLYRGDLLEGWYQDWCLFERERLQGMYLSMLEKRMAFCETRGLYEAGLECGTCALRYDVAQERIHRRLMRLHYLGGNRTAALRQYERCVTFLRQELGVEPSKHTAALYEQIRSDHPLDPRETQSTNQREATTKNSPTLPHLLDQLEQLQIAFTQTQGKLQATIQAVRVALNGRD